MKMWPLWECDLYLKATLTYDVSDSKNSTLNRSGDVDRETDNRLDELEKSLQAASHSIMQSQPYQQQQVSGGVYYVGIPRRPRNSNIYPGRHLLDISRTIEKL